MSKRGGRLLAIALLVVGIGVWFFGGFRATDVGDAARANQRLAAFLSADAGDEFAAVSSGYTLRFPRDHAAHPTFRQEWWYFTGNLADDAGRRFGYQLTFFRFATPTTAAVEEGPWNSGQTWMSHFAITDVDGDKLIADEDFARGGLGLAGATDAPFKVWTNGWSATQMEGSCADCFAMNLVAKSNNQAINLLLETDRPPLLHGDRGYSVKSNDGDVASYYYAYPGLRTSGTLTVGNRSVAVTGSSWMDREWSSAVLAKGQAGWDWFALHLDDGRKLMVFQVRGDGGDDYRYGVLHHPDRPDQDRRLTEIRLTPSNDWQSDATGGRYPLQWQLQSRGVDLRVTAAVKNQELDFLFAYYEGVVDVNGQVDGAQVTGVGYLEMTGYVD